MTTLTAPRTYRITIDTPYDDNQKSVTYHRRCEFINDDDVSIGVSNDAPPPISFNLKDEALTMVTATDPGTGQAVTVSIAGIAALIKADYVTRAGG